MSKSAELQVAVKAILLNQANQVLLVREAVSYEAGTIHQQAMQQLIKEIA